MTASMNQRTFCGSKPTLLDVAKDAVEKFLKARARDVSSRGDRYMLLTFEDPPLHVKAGWKESHAVFMNELRNLTASGITNMGSALKNAFDLLNLNRMQSGIDMYGLGRCPYYLEPAIIIVITDGSKLTTPTSISPNLELPMQNHAIPGSELTREPFRWDQRLFSLVLRMSGTSPSDSTQTACQTDNSPISAMCSVTAGRSYCVTSTRALQQSIDSLVQKLQSGVVMQFEKVGPDPPPLPVDPSNNNAQQADANLGWQSTKSLVYVPRTQKGYVGHWPIPEAFWSDANLSSLPQRTAHPIVKFNCSGVEPHVMDSLPFDKYELEPSALTKYIIYRQQPQVAWQVYISKSNKSDGLGCPFGYLKASTNLSCVNLFVMPYNYPALLPLLQEILNKPQLPCNPPREWRQPFDDYLRSIPPYYVPPLKRALSRMNAVGNLVPDYLDSNCYSYHVHGKLKNYKNESRIQLNKLQAMVSQPKQQSYETVRILQCGKSLKTQVESTSFVNMKCTGKPLNAFSHRYSSMRSELVEFPGFMIRVRDRSTIPNSQNVNSYSMAKQTFRNPFDIDREDLIDKIQQMRANFLQNPTKIKYKDEDQMHSLPIAQMGNYQDYLKKRPAPLREIESSPVRQHMFGNPFKIDKKGMMVDEADIDIGGSPRKKPPMFINNGPLI